MLPHFAAQPWLPASATPTSNLTSDEVEPVAGPLPDEVSPPDPVPALVVSPPELELPLEVGALVLLVDDVVPVALSPPLSPQPTSPTVITTPRTEGEYAQRSMGSP